MAGLDELVADAAHQHEFSGAVSVERDGESELAVAYGMANRVFGVVNTVDTQFAIASGTKGFTALAVMSLVGDGVLDLTTTARSGSAPISR